ncbi:hypothetical protein TNCV_37351 [Trichonephila clavipes]|nr:hypothetical protein TNCV_37351 [Trichonephila clavipes]
MNNGPTRIPIDDCKVKRICWCFLCHPINGVRSRPTKFIVVWASFMSVASRSFEHYAGDSAFGFGYISTLRKNTLGGDRGPPLLFPFHQPFERSYDSTNI